MKLDEAAVLAQAETALRAVVDPEIGINVVDLGLVHGLRLRGDVLDLTYQLTSATCPIGGMMAAAMHDALDALPGVMGVDMHLLDDPPWSADRISPQGKKILGIDGTH
jgi:metal-sulfur cluster biosynthetic enzyme